MLRKRLCQCCYDVSPDIADFICPRCLKEWRTIQRVYTLTAPYFDTLKKKSVAQFVLALWKKLGLDKQKHLRHTILSKPRKHKTDG